MCVPLWLHSGPRWSPLHGFGLKIHFFLTFSNVQWLNFVTFRMSVNLRPTTAVTIVRILLGLSCACALKVTGKRLVYLMNVRISMNAQQIQVKSLIVVFKAKKINTLVLKRS
jgi:hypothetical protein